MAANSYAALLKRLFADYERKHTLSVIEEVAAASRDELAGQARPGAELELLERLARQRLIIGGPSYCSQYLSAGHRAVIGRRRP